MALWINTVSATEMTHSSSEEEVIHITSNILISDNTSQTIEFKGNVKATQKDTIITANNMVIYYNKEAQTKEKTTPDEQSISKITAMGDVHINFDNRVAQADKAVYTVENRTLVLTGKNVLVTSKTNSITGEKITLNRNNGKIIVEPGNGKQVEMIVNTDGNGIK